jgi:hypothetical protein
MPPPRRTRLFAVLAAPLLALAAAPARAEPPEPDAAVAAANKAAARTKAARALQLFDERRWAEAFEAFKEADDLYHAPTLTLAMAQCQRNMGRLLAARALYQHLVDEPLPPDAPEKFLRAPITARSELAALDGRIPKVAIAVTGPGADRARIQIAGVPHLATELASDRQLDPGDHVISAETDGGGSARLAFHLTEGASSRVDLVLSTARPPVIKWAGLTDGRSPFPVAAGILLGLGGAVAAGGGGAGIVALLKSDDIRSRCQTIGTTLHCLVADVPERNQAQALSTTSIVGLAAGGALLVTGTVLAVVRPGARTPQSRPAEPPPIEVHAGPGSLLIRGRF